MAATNGRDTQASLEITSIASRAERMRPVSGLLGLPGPGYILGPWPWPVEVVILAAIASFVAHLLRLGWQAKFGVTVIE